AIQPEHVNRRFAVAGIDNLPHAQQRRASWNLKLVGSPGIGGGGIDLFVRVNKGYAKVPVQDGKQRYPLQWHFGQTWKVVRRDVSRLQGEGLVAANSQALQLDHSAVRRQR